MKQLIITFARRKSQKPTVIPKADSTHAHIHKIDICNNAISNYANFKMLKYLKFQQLSFKTI